MAIKTPKGYRRGKAKKSSCCCREIRICTPNQLGRVYDGWSEFGNSESNREIVMVIKESTPYDMDKTIVVELTSL